MKNKVSKIIGLLTLLMFLSIQCSRGFAQGTAFIYQGRLQDQGVPANGRYDLTFALFDASQNGNQAGTTITNLATVATNGLFTVTLDFGAQFPGADRWLAISVRTNGDAVGFTGLTPRQPVTATPYAVQALNATTAATAATAGSAGTVAAAGITGMIPLAQLPAGIVTNGARGVNLSGTFSGDGGGLTNLKATQLSGTIPAAVLPDVLNTLSEPGIGNFFAGSGAGASVTTGNANTANGSGALAANTTGFGNTAVGFKALYANTNGSDNTANGDQALAANTTGSDNTANGYGTLAANTTGEFNTANGDGALYANTNGNYNTANGNNALQANTSGSDNTANGSEVLQANTTGNGNTAAGATALQANTTGSFNTAVGNGALFNNTNGSHNIAIGSQAGGNLISGNNNIYLGNLGAAGDNGIIRIGIPGTQTDTYLAGTVHGNGGGLTNLNAAQLIGSIPATQLSGTLANGVLPASPVFSGTVTATIFSGNGANVTNVNAATLNGLDAANFWQLGGNNVSAGQFFGSTNDQPVEIRVGNVSALRLEPDASGADAPNVIGGASVNFVAAGVGGATIAGGGATHFIFGSVASNSVLAAWGTVGGGLQNAASSQFATVAGGFGNTAGGGANGSATVSGGSGNQATNDYATVPGGYENVADGQYSFAAGDQAQATNDGAFVWADSQPVAFASTNNDSFNVRAKGGVRFVTGGAGMTIDGQPVLTSGNGSGITIQQTASGAPNVIEGAPINYVAGGVFGATIGGGGMVDYQGETYNVSNSVTENWGTVSGGYGNTASNFIATVGGGDFNVANGQVSTVAGGQDNIASGTGSFVGGGGVDGGFNISGNQASGNASAITGGLGNQATGNYAAVPGGRNNLAGGEYSFAAGQRAKAVNDGAFVWADSQAADFDSAINDSFNVRAQGGARFVTGGAGMTIDGQPVLTSGSSIPASQLNGMIPAGNLPNGLGGEDNTASDEYAAVSGGYTNTASSLAATVSGGYDNAATNDYAMVGGGAANTAGGGYATVSGGSLNSAEGDFSSVGGGDANRASGKLATVPGGLSNIAGGEYSFAAGQQAQALHDGTFVWADSQNADFSSTSSNQFLIRAQGGVGIGINAPLAGSLSVNTNIFLFDHAIYFRGRTGVDMNHGLGYNGQTITNFGTGQYQIDGPALWGYSGGLLGTRNGGDHAALQWNATSVTVNGTFNNLSDRNAKQDFTTITPAQILAKVTQLPLSEWSYKMDTATRHIGPMAQDFYAAFNVGTDDRHIAPIDENGVALAAIQGLNQKVEDRSQKAESQIGELKTENAKLQAQVTDLRSQLESLQKAVARLADNSARPLALNTQPQEAQ